MHYERNTFFNTLFCVLIATTKTSLGILEQVSFLWFKCPFTQKSIKLRRCAGIKEMLFWGPARVVHVAASLSLWCPLTTYSYFIEMWKVSLCGWYCLLLLYEAVLFCHNAKQDTDGFIFHFCATGQQWLPRHLSINKSNLKEKLKEQMNWHLLSLALLSCHTESIWSISCHIPYGRGTMKRLWAWS